MSQSGRLAALSPTANKSVSQGHLDTATVAVLTHASMPDYFHVVRLGQRPGGGPVELPQAPGPMKRGNHLVAFGTFAYPEQVLSALERDLGMLKAGDGFYRGPAARGVEMLKRYQEFGDLEYLPTALPAQHVLPDTEGPAPMQEQPTQGEQSPSAPEASHTHQDASENPAADGAAPTAAARDSDHAEKTDRRAGGSARRSYNRRASDKAKWPAFALALLTMAGVWALIIFSSNASNFGLPAMALTVIALMAAVVTGIIVMLIAKPAVTGVIRAAKGTLGAALTRQNDRRNLRGNSRRGYLRRNADQVDIILMALGALVFIGVTATIAAGAELQTEGVVIGVLVGLIAGALTKLLLRPLILMLLGALRD